MSKLHNPMIGSILMLIVVSCAEVDPSGDRKHNSDAGGSNDKK